MALKVVDFRKTVFELCSTDSQVGEILALAGFADILKPGMLNTAGRFMKIPMGATLKRINLEAVKQLFTEYGYTIID